ncbi:ABC transporter permease [Zavarzinella formosa]|uniref:ABC transporter permease n=1 Tax=Zavarzinella formosa TaxID=360055 RepID=UPI000363127B|nr:ABC transporter permease [Zavarzinella formosa]
MSKPLGLGHSRRSRRGDLTIGTLRLIVDLARNDWKLFLADRRAAVMCFLVPIVLASAFGLIFDRPGQNLGEHKLPLLLVNENTTGKAQPIIDDLLKGGHIEGKVVDRATAEREVARRSCGVAIVFPADFDWKANKPRVEMLHHPMSAAESQWAEGLLMEVCLKRLAAGYLRPFGLKPAGEMSRPVEVCRVTIPANGSHPFNSYSHSFCGMTLQYLLFWGLESGLLFLRERQRGLWRRVRVAPVSLTTVLFGRALATASIALLQIACTFAFGNLVFGVTITGSWWGFIGLAVTVSLLAAGTGLCVAAIGGTEARARSMFIVVILGLSMLGGLWLPAFLLPVWVQDVSQALPTSWAMRGMDAVTWQGQDFARMFPSLLAVSLFAIAFMALAIGRFHWAERQRRKGVSA